MSGRIEDALTNQAAVGARHAGLFLVLAAGDHQPRGDLQFAQHVALLVRIRHPRRLVAVLVQVVGVRVCTWLGVSTSRWASRKARGSPPHRGELDAMHGQAQARGEVAEQAEAVAGLDDEQSRPVDRRHLVQDVVERGALA